MCPTFYCKVCNACLNRRKLRMSLLRVFGGYFKMKYVAANHIEGRVFLNITHCSPRGTERCGHTGAKVKGQAWGTAGCEWFCDEF